MLKWIHISKTVITTWHHAVISDLTSLGSDMPLNTRTEFYPSFSSLNTVSANTTTDIFHKYVRNSGSFCLLLFFFNWHKSFTQSKKKKGAVIFKQKFSLYKKRAEMDRKVMHGRQWQYVRKQTLNPFSLCRTLRFNWVLNFSTFFSGH